jgi:hypothetical protein
MQFSAFFASERCTAQPAFVPYTGTPVKSNKVKTLRKKNLKGLKISNPVLIDSTGAELNAIGLSQYRAMHSVKANQDPFATF